MSHTEPGFNFAYLDEQTKRSRSRPPKENRTQQDLERFKQ